MPILLYPMLSFSIVSHPYPYFVYLDIFLNLSGILYMVSE